MSTTTKFRPVHRIDRSRALDFLSDETDGLIWSAYFRKTDGSMREMVCRRGVAKALAGGGLRYDARSKGLVPVFDMTKRQYRMVNVGTLVSFNFHGATYIVD
jgi:hypothetical protein